MATLKEIAKECNVSATTVSNILNGRPKVSEETKQKVLEVVHRRGYQPDYIAQGLRRKKTNCIGIIAEDIHQFTTPEILEGIMEVCEAKGYRTMIQNLRLYMRWNDTWYHNDTAYRSVMDPVMQEMISLKVDGLLYVAGHGRIIPYLAENNSIPSVMVYAYTESEKVPSIVIDDEKGGYEMTKYLISKGHRKIGVIGGKKDNIHTQKRLMGYQTALFEKKIFYNPAWVRYGDWERPSGYEQARFLAQEGLTAIFCMNDNMTGGVYDYFREKGVQIGEEISIAGFDNRDISEYFYPRLTTMELSLRKIGIESACLLLDSLEGGQSLHTKNVVEKKIPCTLIERESVKCINPST